MSMQRVGGLGVDFHSGTLFLALPSRSLCPARGEDTSPILLIWCLKKVGPN